MNREFLTYYKEFEDSFIRFKETANNSKTEYEKDIVVQRFQFTVALFIEVLKQLLNKNNVSCVYPSDCIKKAAHFGLIPAEKIFLEMLEDRYEIINLKSRIPEKLYQRIKIKYVIALGIFIEKIQTNYIMKR